MKNAKYIFVPLVIFALLVLFSCKKDELKIHKLEFKTETVVKDRQSAEITVEYTYPVRLERVVGSISVSGDMVDVSNTQAVINDKVFVVKFQELQANTTYYYQYEYSNGVDLIKTEIKSFTTDDYGLPVVITDDVSNITVSSASCGGNVTDAGGLEITARGVCWSTNQNPTINDVHTMDGTGLGIFTSNITELVIDTKYYVRAYATTSKGTSYGLQKEFTTLSGMSVVKTNEISSITATSAICGGNVTDAGGLEIIARGVCWSTNANPTVNDEHTTDGTGIGEFISSITNLSIGTKYYVRAYATTNAGTSYGSQKEFTTQDGLPSVTTASISNLTATSATCGGVVTDDGEFEITARGVCWSAIQNPTVNDAHSTDGVGIGSYTSDITDLMTNTHYYVRAYATNAIGTSYGSQIEFTTENGLPTVYTSGATNITTTTATCSGDVTNDGGFEITAKGFCWSTSPNPTVNDSHTVDGTGTGSFTSNLTDLNSYTKYYARAYATNINGSSYSGQIEIMTLFQAPEGGINSLFSVSATKQVCFSKGNLQYQASTNTWRFAENQYDYIGDANSNISSSYTGWIDFFGWGTSGYNHGAVCYQPYSTSITCSDYYAYGNASYNLYDQTGKADWGYNRISNGGNTENQWRTLTNDEWMYVFNTRSTASGIRYAKAYVNGVNGVILLPDDWNTSTYSLNSTNTSNASFTTNIITVENWSILENAGAVFLPAAGYRVGTDVDDVGSYGSYWSASYIDSYHARSVYFYYDSLGSDIYNGRNGGFSVRLVCSAEN